MTLPPEDRDLIERVLGYDADENVKTLLLTPSDLAKLFAAVRAEAAPVVDDDAVERALDRYNLVAARETETHRIGDDRDMGFS